MPIFSRRRLQSMIDELGPWIPGSKARDIVGRLDGRDTKQAMSAEAELALTWAVHRVRHIVVEPEFKNTSARIDLAAYAMFGEDAAAIEITALSDDQFSGKEDMDRAASIIGQFANRHRKKADLHLYFTFANSGAYERDPRTNRSRYRRVRHVSPNYKLTPDHETTIRTWVTDPNWPSPQAIKLKNEHIDVVIAWRDSVHPEGRTFCSMPPVAYDLRDNPLYKQLKRKAHQLRGVPNTLTRCVFVVDAGCHLLRNLRPISSTGQEKGGAEIIEHFLEDTDIDVVCVFSQHRPHQILGLAPQPKIQWRVSYFDRRRPPPPAVAEGLQQIASQLPLPNLEAYTARSLHRQGAFTPTDLKGLGGYKIQSRKNAMTIEISSRLVYALLAGQITQQEFEQRSFRDGVNQFQLQLLRGMTLKDVRLNPAGVDRDDDWIAFELSADPAVSALRPAAAGTLKDSVMSWFARVALPLFVWSQKTRDLSGRKNDAATSNSKRRPS